jgi:hypothetical protein
MKILYIFIIWLFLYNVIAENALNNTDFENDVKFIQDFIEHVYDDAPFTVDDQKRFFGEIEWIDNSLKMQILRNTRLRYILEKNHNISFWGTLCQLNRKKLAFNPTDHGSIIWGKSDGRIVSKQDRIVGNRLPKYSYVIMVERPRQMNSLFDYINRVVCWSISREDGKRYISPTLTLVSKSDMLDAMGFKIMNHPLYLVMVIPEEELAKLVKRIELLTQK